MLLLSSLIHHQRSCIRVIGVSILLLSSLTTSEVIYPCDRGINFASFYSNPPSEVMYP